MALTDAQKRAINKYAKNNVHVVALRFYPADEDLWQKVKDWTPAQIRQALRVYFKQQEDKGC